MTRAPLVLCLLLLVAAAPACAGVLGPTVPVLESNLRPQPLTRIAFGSCADQRLPQPILDRVLEARPELFVFLGDNVYGDASTAELTELKQAYAALAGIEGFRRLTGRTPTLAVWDDHDYGVNDGGADFPHKEAAKQLFLDFWAVPAGDPRRTRPGLYRARVFGPPGRRVQVILLDTRSFRAALKPSDAPGTPGKERYIPDPDPAKTLLGAAQWRWLDQQLRRPAELRLIVSSIQVIAAGHGFERWGNLPLERRRLLDLIAETGADGVIFLSGDRHLGALYRLDEGVPYPLYEATSSSLNRPYSPAAEAGPHRLGSWYGAENFGLIAIDWEGRRLALELRGLEGTAVRRVDVPFDAIRRR